MSLVHVKCVICSHRFSAPLTSEMPMCPLCMGPVTVERAETARPEPVSRPKTKIKPCA
jgi:hypothetical protein